jgi:hypothetical protein
MSVFDLANLPWWIDTFNLSPQSTQRSLRKTVKKLCGLSGLRGKLTTEVKICQSISELTCKELS